MKMKLIQITQIPNAIHQEVGRTLGDYSVAIARCRNDDPNRFGLVGSGTCVVRNGVRGILTAHHCLHACSPEITLGGSSTEDLYFVLQNGRGVLVPSSELIETPLGRPAKKHGYGSHGPDLTFITIPPGPRLSSFSAVNSFWSLNKDPKEVIQNFCAGLPYITNMGYPEESHRITLRRNVIDLDVTRMSFFGVLNPRQISSHGRWDYVETVCSRRYGGRLPTTFRGVSGGGIWAIKLRLKGENGIVIEDFCLVGVSFFERQIDSDQRAIKGHFIRSIYDSAWLN